MNYQKIYDDICKRGQERILPKEVYTEKHHIIPKCLGGDDSKENLTVLTAREHFLVHYILAEKLYSNHKGLWYALIKMCGRNERQERCVISSMTYEYLRQRHQTNNSGEKNNFYGKRHSEETLLKIKSSLSGPNHHKYGKTHSNEHKQKIGNSLKGRIFSQDTLKKMSDSQKENQNNSSPIIHVQSQRVFESCIAASKYFGVGQNTITKRIKSGIFEKISKQDFLVLSKTNKDIPVVIPAKRIRTAPVTQEFVDKCRNNSISVKVCNIDGVIYQSVRYASDSLSIPYYTVHHRIKSDSIKWKQWFYV